MNANSNKYKDEALECIIATIPFDIPPYDLISEIERNLGVKKCILQVKVFIDRSTAISLCSSEAVRKLSTMKHLTIAGKKCPFQYCEQVPRRIRLLNLHPKMTVENVDGRIQMFGKVFYSEVERQAGYSNNYFAVVDLKRPLPDKVTIRRREYDAVCL